MTRLLWLASRWLEFCRVVSTTGRRILDLLVVYLQSHFF